MEHLKRGKHRRHHVPIVFDKTPHANRAQHSCTCNVMEEEARVEMRVHDTSSLYWTTKLNLSSVISRRARLLGVLEAAFSVLGALIATYQFDSLAP